jgi:hypothetical protein
MKTMNYLKNRRVWLASGCLMLSGLLLTGCGLATTPPVSVTIKPAEEGAVASAAATTTATPAANAATPAAGGSSDLVGTVVFDGAPPNLPPLIAQGADVKDKAVCSAMVVPDETLLVDPASKGVQNVFVFLEKAPAGASPVPPPEKQIFDQKGCKFIPHAIIVRTKVPLMILSDDSVGHNTHTYPARNSGFNGAINANERKGVAVTYAQPEREPFSVKCDVHPWMGAYHLPLDHGYAAITNEKGEFTIKGLPAGEHTLKVWHESGKLLERSLKVKVPSKDPLALKYNAAKFGK